MGGYGSGRPSYKQKAEHCRSLDIFKMKRHGCLEPGSLGSWVWWREGEEVARINYKCTGRTLKLNYRVRQYGDEWEAIAQTATLAYTACNFGGKRTYIICPGVVGGRRCGSRVGKLYAGGRYFLCRQCYRIAYSSQSELHYDRKLRRANKMRMALGGEPGTAYCIAPKPKGMWWRTYRRMVEEIEACKGVANHLLIQRFSRLLSPKDRATFFDK